MRSINRRRTVNGRNAPKSSLASVRSGLLTCFLLTACAWQVVGDDQTPTKSEPAAQPLKELFTGRVVFLEDALKKRDIDSYEETGKHVVLETDGGELIPILADWRGRAFYQDERLRNRKVELIGFRRPGLPYLNVMAVYTFDVEGERMYTDYWCDICSIPMYQIQPCDCCQGEVRLRFQKQDLPDYIVKPVRATSETKTSAEVKP